MLRHIRNSIVKNLRWSEKYTKTDMVYFVSGNFWLFASRVVTTGTGFLLTVGFANLLSQNDFGTYKYILAAAGLVSALTLTGIAPASQRAIAKGHTNVIRPLVAYAARWSIFATLASLSVALYYFYQGNTMLGASFLIVAMSMHFSWTSINKSLFISQGEFKTAAYFNIIRALATTLLTLFALIATHNVLIVIATFFLSQVVFGIYTYRRSLSMINPSRDERHADEALHYSRHASLTGILQVVAQYIDHFLLWHFLGPVALATYAIAQGPAKEIRALAEMTHAVALPKIMGRDARTHFENKTVIRRTVQSSLAVVFVAGAYILIAPFLFRIFFPLYMDAVTYSQLIAFALIFQQRSLFTGFLTSHGTVKDMYLLTIPASVTSILAALLLIPTLGIIGAILVPVVTEILMIGITWYRYEKLKRDTVERI